MKRRFDWLMLVLTLAFSLVGATVILAMKDMLKGTSGMILWCGLYFAIPLLCSLLGVVTATKIHSKKYIFHKTGNRALSFVLAFVLSMAIGCGGEALYLLRIERTEAEEQPIATEPAAEPDPEPEPESEATEPVVLSEGVDVSLIIDFSGSMSGVLDSCKEAACELVDELSEETYLQFITFADKIFDMTDLTLLDSSAKESMKETINASKHIAGATNFNKPMNAAYQTLTTAQTGSDRKAVVIISDATWSDEGSIGDDLKQSYIDDNITVYLVSIKTTNIDVSKLTAFKSFAEETGGFETVLESGGIDTEALIKAIEAAYAPSEESSEKEESPVKENDPLPAETPAPDANPAPEEDGGAEISIVFAEEGWLPFGFDGIVPLLVRIIFFILYALLTSGVMYFTITLREVKSAAIIGGAAALIVTLTGIIGEYAGAMLSTLIIAVAFWTALTFYYPSRGDEEDVQ